MSVGWQRGSINNIELTNVREAPAPEKQAEGKLQGRKVTLGEKMQSQQLAFDDVRAGTNDKIKNAREMLLEAANKIAGQIDRGDISQKDGKAQFEKLLKSHIEVFKGEVNAVGSKFLETLNKAKSLAAKPQVIQTHIDKVTTQLEKSLKNAKNEVKGHFRYDFNAKANDPKYTNFKRNLDKIGVSLEPPLTKAELAVLNGNRRFELLKAPAKSSLDKAASLISRVRVDSFSPKLHGLISHVKNAFNRT